MVGFDMSTPIEQNDIDYSLPNSWSEFNLAYTDSGTGDGYEPESIDATWTCRLTWEEEGKGEGTTGLLCVDIESNIYYSINKSSISLV